MIKQSKKKFLRKQGNDIDVDKTLIWKKRTIWHKKFTKYFIGYNDNGAIRPLCIKLPQMIGYVKHFDSNKTVF